METEGSPRPETETVVPTKRDINNFEKAARAVPSTRTIDNEDGYVGSISQVTAEDGRTIIVATNTPNKRRFPFLNRGKVSKQWTDVTIIDPVPHVGSDGQEQYTGRTIHVSYRASVDRKLNGQPVVSSSDNEYQAISEGSKTRYVRIDTDEDLESVENQDPVSAEEMREVTRLAEGLKDGPTDGRTTMEAERDSAFFSKIMTQTDSLIELGIKDASRQVPSLDRIREGDLTEVEEIVDEGMDKLTDLAIDRSMDKIMDLTRDSVDERESLAPRDAELALLRQMPIGVVLESPKGRYITYITEDGDSISILRPHARPNVSIVERISNDFGNLEYVYSIDEAGSTVEQTTDQNGSQELEGFQGIELPIGSAKEVPMSDDEREGLGQKLGAVKKDLEFADTLHNRVETILAEAESKGVITVEDGVITTRYEVGGETFVVSAKKKQDGSLEELSIEKWLSPNPDRPRDIQTRMYYLDLAYPTLSLAKTMNHFAGDGGLARDISWGPVGIQDEEKIGLYRDMSQRRNYKFEHGEKESLLKSLSLGTPV